ncbi:hypothetical protein BZG36_01580 [Bifiguratus adelaidae]|uniref:Small ribosomal subunit protein mS33 n=1 Tax=Bifiguratus adelaidae TaxID=1938954 RepID=A0A261Y3V4_9FUNG|nr:hypothetical protein BZG36_01580 [Bifiguratus adelaidae]
MAQANPSASRLAQLAKLTCTLFHNVYNPTHARTGNKVLRRRLIGPTLASYYPQTTLKFRQVQAAFPDLGLVDLDEKERLDEISRRKRRGKGAPKKGKWIRFSGVVFLTGLFRSR